MNRALATLTLALLVTAFCGAQTETPSAKPDHDGDGAAKTMSVHGCLSSAQGAFTLNEDGSGSIYNLSGQTEKLQAHIGHDVEVTGQMAGATQNGTGDAGKSLNVEAVKMVSDHCNAPANTGPGAAMDPATALTDARIQAQASTGLPLVGLLGFGSLVAGFLVRR